MHVNFFVLAPGLSALTSILVGAYVLLRDPRSAAHRAQFYFCLTLFGWLACFTKVYSTDDPEMALRWARAGFFFIAFISPSNFNITISLLRDPSKRGFLWGIGAVTALLCALSPTEYIYSHVRRFYWGYYPQAGILYPLFIVQYTFTWLFGLWLLRRRMVALKEARDFFTYNQIRYFFLGCIGGSLGVVDFLGKYGIPIYPFAYVVALFWASIMAFAVLRYRALADISFTIRRALIGSAILVTIAACGGLWYLAIFLLNRYGGVSDTSILLTIGGLGLGVALQPLYRRTTAMVDQMFFSEYHDRERKLAQLGREILLTKSAAEFNRIILEGILACFKAVRASFFLWDEQQQAYVLQSAIGWGLHLDQTAVTRIGAVESLAKYLESPANPILTLSAVLNGRAAEDDQKSMALCMLRLEATVSVPIFAGGRLQGIVVLGDKESGLPYSAEDLDSLKTLAGHMSVVLENIDLIKRWSSEQKQSTRLGEVLHRYMSSSVADEILKRAQSLKAWRGDRRHVAILMADLRGFTGLSEKKPLEEIVQSLNDFFVPMTEIIMSAGGTVDKFMGDAILVVFGAPTVMADAEARAARCALEMQQAMHELNAKRAAGGQFEFEMGIGIAAGEVVAGNIGSDKRMEYTVIGDAVNIASRVQGMARAGQILATVNVAQKIGDAFTLKSLGKLQVRGREKPVELFKITGMKGGLTQPMRPRGAA